MKNGLGRLSVAVFMVAITFSGCATKDVQVTQLEQELQSTSNTLEMTQQEVEEKNSEIEKLKEELETTKAQAEAAVIKSDTATSSTDAGETKDISLTPPNAKAGECYAKVLIPAKYETKTEQKLLKDKVEKISVTDPKFKEVQYKILDKAESFKYVLKPATYKCVQNRVMVEPEKVTYKVVPATFKIKEEKVLVSPAHQVWKKGTGPITKLDNNTGEIMCLVEVPAKYKTVKTKVIDQPAHVEKIVTPAVYKNFKAKVVDQEASYEKVVIPATYKVITVKELAEEAKVNKEVEPEKYQTVEKRFMVQPEELKWQRILCETNTNKNVIKELQQALKDKGYNPGPIDGVFGTQTQKALNAFQKDNGLSQGALTLEALEALGIN
jgi:hypothetical protein